MIISEVKINNFFCFLDENIIEFKKGLNIISSLNSGGKSQLFNAFYWTFFDKVYIEDSLNATKKTWCDANNHLLIPDYYEDNSQVNDIIKCFVQIKLTTDNEESEDSNLEEIEYTFLKKIEYIRKAGDDSNSGFFSVFTPSELEISYKKDGETFYILQSNITYFLEKIFPTSIRKFMWYQGETVDELYDFSKPATLKHAINEISYFPVYDNIEKIVGKSSEELDRLVNRQLTAEKKLTSTEQQLIRNISDNSKKIIEQKKVLEQYLEDFDKILTEIHGQESKLKNYDKYRDLKEKLNELNAEKDRIKLKIDYETFSNKELLINKWMLNACDELVENSTNNLEIINVEINRLQKTENPVPISLPGPEYVQKMLQDKICYICERSIEDESSEYHALVKRLNDFKENYYHKYLIDNYTDLNRERHDLSKILPEITSELKNKKKVVSELIRERKIVQDKIELLYKDSGEENDKVIRDGAFSASQILQILKLKNEEKERLDRRIDQLNRELKLLKDSVDQDTEEKNKSLSLTSQTTAEQLALPYVKLFTKCLNTLKNEALTKLIKEIELESNRLYNLYLGGNTQGLIEIDKGIRILDRTPKRRALTNLNTAEIVAQKLAVANAFLSLSEKKMNKSYPIIADAPTSDLDHKNTYSLTVNIGSSFNQMIIMSKDYFNFEGDSRRKLIQDAKIVTYYEFVNKVIDGDLADVRSNRKTFITKIV
jgi:DNA sulfur modification protein DndD